MLYHYSRREFLRTTGGLFGAALWGSQWSSQGFAADTMPLPKNNPTQHLKLNWTNQLKWENVVSLKSYMNKEKLRKKESMPFTDLFWDEALENAQKELEAKGGGVIFFPALPGPYQFRNSIQLKNGVILRGDDPHPRFPAAHDSTYSLVSQIEFPKYNPILNGQGRPITDAFKGIVLEKPAEGTGCAVVNISINRGHIHFGETEDHKCGRNRMVFGCILRNAAVADPRVPDVAKLKQHAWQRFTHRHHAAIDVKSAENLLIANNRLPRSGSDNFTMNGYLLKTRKGTEAYDKVVFDYDNRPGMYINHYCIGGSGGSGNDGTPETHPWGFRKGNDYSR